MAYPYGPVLQLLAVTGQRKSDIAEARWSEIDMEKKLLTIPAERFKSECDHVVPLSDMAVSILKTLPRFNKGDYLFSTDFGVKPVNGFSKCKFRLDKAMKDKLGEVAPFVIHDIRRTVRTGFSAFPEVQQHVRELAIGHTQQGLHKVYDKYDYLSEKRRCLDLWAEHLSQVVQQKSSAPLSS
jgi:integrase